MTNKKVLGVTGHRLKCFQGDKTLVKARLFDLAVKVLEKEQPDEVISGMANGWDWAVASAAVELKIPLVAAIPSESHCISYASWLEDNKEYVTPVIVSEGEYKVWKFQKRNEYIVDNSTLLYALWNGESGGTKNCVTYARGKLKIFNVWSTWVKYNGIPTD